MEFCRTLDKSITKCSHSVETAKHDLGNITDKVQHLATEIKTILDTTKMFKKFCMTSIHPTFDKRLMTDRPAEQHSSEVGLENGGGKQSGRKERLHKKGSLTNETRATTIDNSRKLVLPPIDMKLKTASKSCTQSVGIDASNEVFATSGSKISQIKKIARKRSMEKALIQENTEDTDDTHDEKVAHPGKVNNATTQKNSSADVNAGRGNGENSRHRSLGKSRKKNSDVRKEIHIQNNDEGVKPKLKSKPKPGKENQ